MSRALPQCVYMMEQRHIPPSMLFLRFAPVLFLFVLLFRKKSGRQLNLELFVKLSPCHARVSRRLLMKLRLKLKRKVGLLFCIYIPAYLLMCLFLCDLLYISPLFSERTPGNIDSLADLLLSDLKNFRLVRKLGESSARFICKELEKTWVAAISPSCPNRKPKNGF